MELYKDDEILKLEKNIKLTKEVYNILRNKKKEFRENGRKISMSKILCNLIIEKYENRN